MFGYVSNRNFSVFCKLHLCSRLAKKLRIQPKIVRSLFLTSPPAAQSTWLVFGLCGLFLFVDLIVAPQNVRVDTVYNMDTTLLIFINSVSLTIANTNDSITSDYNFNVGLNDQFLNWQTFGCTTTGCSISNMWLINTTNYPCNNATVSVSIVETDFSTPISEYAEIYINSDFISKCIELDDHSTFLLEKCGNVTDYDISNYINSSYYGIQYVSVTLDASSAVGGEKFNGYQLYGKVSINCQLPYNFSTLECDDGTHGSDNNKLTFNVQTDYYPQQTSWFIYDDLDNVVLNGSGDSNLKYEYITQNRCVDNGCYRLELLDSNNDGLTLDSGYSLLFNDYLVTLDEMQQFINGSQVSLYFCNEYILGSINSSSVDDDQNDNNDNNITIVTDGAFGIVIMDVSDNDNNNNSFLIYKNTYENGDYLESTFFIKDGCYNITLSGDTLIYYQIQLNGDSLCIGASNGDDISFSTNIICTNGNTSTSNDTYTTTQCSSPDYTFDVGAEGGVFTNSQLFGCSTSDCSVSKTWLINTTNYDCSNASLSVSIIENEFGDEIRPEAAYIYINGDYIARCSDLDDSTFELVECSEVTDYNLVKYNYIDDTLFGEQYIVVTLDINEWVTVNTFNGYLLYGKVRISCELLVNYSTCSDSGDYNNDNELRLDVQFNNIDAEYDFDWTITSDTDDVVLEDVEDVYSNDELFSQFSCVSDDCFTLSLYASSALSNGGWYNLLFNGKSVSFGNQYATNNYNSTLYFCSGMKIKMLACACLSRMVFRIILARNVDFLMHRFCFAFV